MSRHFFDVRHRASFPNQVEIESVTTGGEFSAGGDSGSAIIDGANPILKSWLFAGGGGRTYANQASKVVSYSGIVF